MQPQVRTSKRHGPGLAPNYRRPVRTPRPSALGAAAGIATGLVVAVVLVVGGSFDGRLTAVPVADATEPFMAAFQRSLDGTYYVQANYTRTLTDGRQLTSRSLVVQRPPDSLRRQFGSISGTVDSKVVTCSGTTGGTTGDFHCGPSVAAPDPAQTRQTTLDNLRTYFADPAVYRVTADGPDCFELTQNRPSTSLPYGSEARFCFDPDTGAIRLLREKLDGATDQFEATLIRGQVTGSDFSLVPSSDFGTQADGVDGGSNGSSPVSAPDAGPTTTAG